MADEVVLSISDAEELAMRACAAAGASDASARSLVDATLSAALHGPATLGFPHFLDYLNSLLEGRINPDPSPRLDRPYPAFLTSDADGGIAQLGFDLAFREIVDTARTLGVAVFTQSNSYSTGELGYYVRRLAAEGIVGFAATNANAFMVANDGGPAVYSTNPLAFSFPLGEGSPPLLIDQSASETAYVNIVAAAAENRPIPAGWALDETGSPTTDPAKALRGALLPFGGRKGANIALMVEMLSAGLSGGNWSLDAPSFNSGDARPALGLTVIAMMPGAPDDNRPDRARRQVSRLRGFGVHVPGVGGAGDRPPVPSELEVPRAVLDAIRTIADG